MHYTWHVEVRREFEFITSLELVYHKKKNYPTLTNAGTKGRDIVRILLKNGADPKAVDANGWDALMIAAVRTQLYS